VESEPPGGITTIATTLWSRRNSTPTGDLAITDGIPANNLAQTSRRPSAGKDAEESAHRARYIINAPQQHAREFVRSPRYFSRRLTAHRLLNVLYRMIIFIPLAVLVAVSLLYRDELSGRALIVYWALWLIALIIVLGFGFSPGIFVAVQCALAVAMLIHVRANPQI
jgi:hypothetical protein